VAPRDTQPDPASRDVHAKALLNLASVNLEMAEAALAQAASLSRASRDQASPGEAIAEQALRVADRIRSQFAASPGSPTGTAQASHVSAALGAPPVLAVPSSRSPAVVSDPTAPSASVPTTPVIEYLRGAPTR
jgi:hypothetical protein